ncbi:unnamed protein product [Macrosiphum euphorbiae]|uniref:Uncharacterized protein n=1 Tax=Macrosiphum euphorbiae TaxID=13131 RepID=A0AAV0XSU4_9HEMI|nr:unnamed protein product [Macrosiphum euphorbiae]
MSGKALMAAMCRGGSGGDGGDGYTGRRRITRSSPSRPYTITNTWFARSFVLIGAVQLRSAPQNGRERRDASPDRTRPAAASERPLTAPVTDPDQQPAKRTRTTASVGRLSL